jgi:large subunit ribosomal protein L10
MQKSEKERVVAELTERLQRADTLIVADYRGLTNSQIEGLRGRLVEHGARLSVVKNTLTRRAAEAAGADALLALLEGPSAIAFIETDGDAVAVAKALSDTARETKVLALKGGVMQGKAIDSSAVEELAKLPPLEQLRGQVIGAIVAPLMQLVGLVNAPLRDFVGLVDARIEQLGGEAPAEDEPPVEAEAPTESEAEAEAPPEAEAPTESEAEAPAPPEAETPTEPEPEAAARDDGGSDTQAPEAEEAAASEAEAAPEEAAGSEPQSPTADETLSVAAEVEQTPEEE